MASNGRTDWFTQILGAALSESVMEPADVTKHATPDVLAKHLPAELMSKVLQAALSAGSMTPSSMLETLEPSALAEHVPHDILWASVEAIAERGAFAQAAESGTGVFDDKRRFLQKLLESGVVTGCLTADDLLEHFGAEVLATHLPTELKAKLLAAGLQANALNAQLVLDTIGVEAMSAHFPIQTLWGCGKDAALRAIGDKTADKKSGGAKAKSTAGKGKGRAKSKAGPPSQPPAVGKEADEAKWVADDDFEVLEESDAVGDILATDWVGDEQTDAGADVGGRRR